MNRTRLALAAVGIVFTVFLVGMILCNLNYRPGGTDTWGTQPQQMEIYVSGIREKKSGILDRKTALTCEVTNTGAPGWVTITGYVRYGEEIHDRQNRRIHLHTGEQKTVSVKLDVKGLGAYNYGFYHGDMQPDK